MAMTEFLANKILDHVLRNTTYTPPATVHVALFRSKDSSDEVGGGGYGRKSATFVAASARGTTNSSLVDFGIASAAWGDIYSVGVFDAATGGNELFHEVLDEPRRIRNGDPATFPIGTILVEQD